MSFLRFVERFHQGAGFSRFAAIADIGSSLEARTELFLKVGTDTVALITETAGCLSAFLVGA